MSLLRRWDASGVPLLAARIVLGATFIGLGGLKAADPVAFLKLLRQYELVSDGSPVLLNVLAVAVPWIEITCGALLLAGIAVRGTALALLAMLTAFTLAIANRGAGIAATDGLPYCSVAFDCGCGTGIVNVCSKLLQNAGLWALAWVALLSSSRRWCLGRPSRVSPP